MRTIGFILCPNLKGSMEGSVCSITRSLIKDMERLVGIHNKSTNSSTSPKTFLLKN